MDIKYIRALQIIIIIIIIIVIVKKKWLPSLAIWSASMTGAPSVLNMLEAALFPVAIPPVSPTRNICPRSPQSNLGHVECLFVCSARRRVKVTSTARFRSNIIADLKLQNKNIVRDLSLRNESKFPSFCLISFP